MARSALRRSSYFFCEKISITRIASVLAHECFEYTVERLTFISSSLTSLLKDTHSRAAVSIFFDKLFFGKSFDSSSHQFLRVFTLRLADLMDSFFRFRAFRTIEKITIIFVDKPQRFT